MSRSEPAYGPMAQLREIAESFRLHRGQQRASTLIVRQDASESPQRLQSGGVNVGMEAQQPAQTGPLVGWSRGDWQDRQCGARTTAIKLSAADFRRDASKAASLQIYSGTSS